MITGVQGGNRCAKWLPDRRCSVPPVPPPPVAAGPAPLGAAGPARTALAGPSPV